MGGRDKLKKECCCGGGGGDGEKAIGLATGNEKGEVEAAAVQH